MAIINWVTVEIEEGLCRQQDYLKSSVARISLALNGGLSCYLSKPAGLIMNNMVFLLEQQYQVVDQQCQEKHY